jgi:copper resistance protein B
MRCAGWAIGAVVAHLPGMALAQSMAGMTMSSPMSMSAAKPAPKAPRSPNPRRHLPSRPRVAAHQHAPRATGAGSARPVSAAPPTMSMTPGEAMHGDAAMGGMTMEPTQDRTRPMAGMAMTGPAPTVGNAAPPPVPMDHYADRYYPATAMTQARRRMMREEGGQPFYQLLFNLAEYQVHNGRDGYRWDGEAWFGGDIDRFELRTEGTGTLDGHVEAGEVQALYSRAIDPYFNVQAGVRRDLESGPARTYASVGVEGLAPYMVQTEARLFVSTRGEVLGRLEAWYDQRLTQRTVLQPRVELNLSAQDSPDRRIGAGLYDAELGLRLRYEVARQFAPYVGISYEANTGRTADYVRADGHSATTTSFVGGARFWF